LQTKASSDRAVTPSANVTRSSFVPGVYLVGGLLRYVDDPRQNSKTGPNRIAKQKYQSRHRSRLPKAKTRGRGLERSTHALCSRKRRDNIMPCRSLVWKLSIENASSLLAGSDNVPFNKPRNSDSELKRCYQYRFSRFYGHINADISSKSAHTPKNLAPRPSRRTRSGSPGLIRVNYSYIYNRHKCGDVPEELRRLESARLSKVLA